jgi:hypothetical protein
MKIGYSKLLCGVSIFPLHLLCVNYCRVGEGQTSLGTRCVGLRYGGMRFSQTK